VVVVDSAPVRLPVVGDFARSLRDLRQAAGQPSITRVVQAIAVALEADP